VLDVLADGRLRDLEAKLEQLAVDARGASNRLFLGSVAESVIRLATKPVFAIHGH
jgi:nucleotide-binding universal stress UspA family protein